MPTDMGRRPGLIEALDLQPSIDGAFTAALPGAFSNGPITLDPEAGTPFGGLLAALSCLAMQDGLDIKPPLRTLSVQYVSPARFGPLLELTPQLLRGGRILAFADVMARQNGRVTHRANGLFGQAGPSPTETPLRRRPPSVDSLLLTPRKRGLLDPHFSQSVEYRFDGEPKAPGGNTGKPAVERVWMRCGDGRPLTTARLAFLLDAAYPAAWTVMPAPIAMATVDLRIDFITDPTPELTPDGWAFFELRMLDLGDGWTIDDATAWAPDGAPLAVARQRRKLAPDRNGTVR